MSAFLLELHRRTSSDVSIILTFTGGRASKSQNIPARRRCTVRVDHMALWFVCSHLPKSQPGTGHTREPDTKRPNNGEIVMYPGAGTRKPL